MNQVGVLQREIALEKRHVELITDQARAWKVTANRLFRELEEIVELFSKLPFDSDTESWERMEERIMQTDWTLQQVYKEFHRDEKTKND